ncbi:MAG: DUF5777 family beta-barrel protein [Ferruginibacter sp.]
MKNYKQKILPFLTSCCVAILILLFTQQTFAQDSTVTEEQPVLMPEVRLALNTFESVFLLDNQTVMVPKKGSLEMAIQHRFGVVNNGYKDVYGLFAPSNIRLGMTFAPINKLNVGIGLTKERMQVDLNAKYAILKQTESNKIPVSVSVFGNMVIDTRDKSNFRHSEYRLSYFSQLLIARKITEKFSAQVAPSFSWFNNVEGYINSKGEIKNKMNNGHLAIAFLGRYKFSNKSAIVVNYDQPLTQHPTNNPHPNIAFGLETTTDSHAFQVFAGNYYGIVGQSNNVFNQNDYTKGQFVIGFNITRLWAF